LTVNVIGLLFLRQCFIRLPSSTETSISGTSPMSIQWIKVSQYVFWRMTWRDVNSCYCDHIMMIFHAFVPLWDFLLRFHAFRFIFCLSCKGMHENEFGRRGVMEFVEKGRHALFCGRFEISCWNFVLFLAVVRFLCEITCFVTAECKTRVREKGLMEYIEKGR
jgi:hypothetical protein